MKHIINFIALILLVLVGVVFVTSPAGLLDQSHRTGIGT